MHRPARLAPADNAGRAGCCCPLDVLGEVIEIEVQERATALSTSARGPCGRTIPGLRRRSPALRDIPAGRNGAGRSDRISGRPGSHPWRVRPRGVAKVASHAGDARFEFAASGRAKNRSASPGVWSMRSCSRPVFEGDDPYCRKRPSDFGKAHPVILGSVKEPGSVQKGNGSSMFQKYGVESS